MDSCPLVQLWMPSIGFRRTFAIAAAVLIVITFLNTDFHFSQLFAALPQTTAEALITTHDGCCKVNDHHFVPAQYASLMSDTGRWLSGKVNVPVAAITVGDGWQYCGAGPCPVAGTKSGHLLFKRGNQSLSIFSMPVKGFGVVMNERYAADVDGHIIAGFTRDGALYCVVGHDPDGKLDEGQIRGVEQSLMDDYGRDVYTNAGNENVPEPPVAVILND
jgi:hypothetical protein